MVIQFFRTQSDDVKFLALVHELDKDLAIRDGEDHAFYAQFNKVDRIKYVLLAMENNEAVGCGAIKEYDVHAMEIKRMFVPPEHRGKGIASSILRELENWAMELGYKRCILETGEKQFEAIALYHKNNYKVIPNYGQYTGVEASICFEKVFE
ncbi:MAG: GNAT family N-acetyltransferase [Bacteroidetes bacterium]|nr:GNAT family N-acetyltransferase [Bacteroidota bacterium]